VRTPNNHQVPILAARPAARAAGDDRLRCTYAFRSTCPSRWNWF